MTLDKLKVAARQHELRSEWRAAVDLYRQAIRASEAEGGSADPGLFNRIGDLEQQAGDTPAACDAWEHAAARYAEQGFFNNAIALSSKILRADPSRTRAYLELARFHARKRVIYDVRQNLSIYQQQMASRGQGEQAAEAIERFTDEFPTWRELREFVYGLLGVDADAEASDVTGGEADSSAPGSGLVFLDVGSDGAKQPAADIPLIIETSSLADRAAALVGEIEGLEPTADGIGEAVSDAPAESLVGDIEIERAVEEDDSAAVSLEGLESTGLDAGGEIMAPSGTLEGLEVTVVELDPAGAVEGMAQPADRPDELADAEHPDSVVGDELVFLDAGRSEEEPAAPEDDDIAAAVEAEPAGVDPIDARIAAGELLERGDREGGAAALERALEHYLNRGDWIAACRTAAELAEVEPWSHGRRQQWVEIAARTRDDRLLTDAYSSLADLLEHDGMQEKAVAVYRRILELDEGHRSARAALRRMVPDAPDEVREDGFVDFGAMVNDDVGPRSTRMRTEATPVSPDEDETFREALAEFRRALDQNLPVEDHQTHYDLGLAFKEMGLLDEAVAEFQKALRSPEGRLRTSEALGEVFYLQGKPAVAEAVLRSVERGAEDDSEKVGVLYWLGRALESQRRNDQARACYERVLAVDVSFADVMDRLASLGSGDQ